MSPGAMRSDPTLRATSRPASDRSLAYVTAPTGCARANERAFECPPMIGRLRHRHVASLGGGERKTVAIGRALVLDPKVLVIDKPTASLTPELSRLILKDVVRKLADDGAGVILVEQKAIEAQAISDWVHVLGSGRVTLSDTPQFLREPARLAIAFFGSAPAVVGHTTVLRQDDAGDAP